MTSKLEKINGLPSLVIEAIYRREASKNGTGIVGVKLPAIGRALAKPANLPKFFAKPMPRLEKAPRRKARKS
jgi:hypothetical protein